MGANEVFMHIKFEGARLRDHNFGGQKLAKSDKFELVYLAKYRY